MAALAPVLWAVLASARLGGGTPAPVPRGAPAWGVPPRGSPAGLPAGAPPPRAPAPGLPADARLSCHRCFKASARAACPPSRCRPADRVCVSHILVAKRKSRRKLVLSKGCAHRCPNTNSKFQWSAGFFVEGQILRQCCFKSLCNWAAGPPAGPWAGGALLLRLGLGLLWALL